MAPQMKEASVHQASISSIKTVKCAPINFVVDQTQRLRNYDPATCGGTQNGDNSPLPASWAGLFKLACRQARQNLKCDIADPAFGRQCHHGCPVASRDAPGAPAAHSRIRLPQGAGNSASAAQGHDDCFRVVHSSYHSSHHAN